MLALDQKLLGGPLKILFQQYRSMAEKLGMSTICPVCPRKRTFECLINQLTLHKRAARPKAPDHPALDAYGPSCVSVARWRVSPGGSARTPEHASVKHQIPPLRFSQSIISRPLGCWRGRVIARWRHALADGDQPTSSRSTAFC